MWRAAIFSIARMFRFSGSESERNSRMTWCSRLVKGSSWDVEGFLGGEFGRLVLRLTICSKLSTHHRIVWSGENEGRKGLLADLPDRIRFLVR